MKTSCDIKRLFGEDNIPLVIPKGTSVVLHSGIYYINDISWCDPVMFPMVLYEAIYNDIIINAEDVED